MARAIDGEVAYRFLTEQLVKETGAFSKGVNKGLNIARSAMRNPDAIPTLTQPNELERAGLYGKYIVLKNEDGSLVTNCFILRPEKDPAAVAALRAYAAATDNAELADDIINWVGAEPNEWVSVEERLPEPGGLIVYANKYGNVVLYGVLRVAKNDRPNRYDYWAYLPELPYRRPPEGEEET